MAINEIIQFTTDQASSDATIQKAAKALKGAQTTHQFVLGTQIQDKTALQITVESDNGQSPSSLAQSPVLKSFLDSTPHSTYHVSLNRPLLSQNGPATSPVVEYVLISFPVSRTTPAFQKGIGADFARFDSMFVAEAQGNGTLATGWVDEELEHAEIKGEKTKSFFIVRGWETMEKFEKSLELDAYKKGIPILFAWNAPFKMVSVLLRCTK